MTDEERHVAALSDPDNPPLTDEQLARMRPVALAKRIRWKLGLSREEFARRYQLPVETVRAWERHEAEPDATARAYLHVIEREPETVARAFERAE